MRKILFALFILACATSARAQCPSISGQAPESFAHETITVADTAVGFTSATYAPGGNSQSAVWAMFTVENDSLRFWTDNGTPTSSQGFLAIAGSVVYICNLREISGFKAIRSASTSVPIQVQYFRVPR